MSTTATYLYAITRLLPDADLAGLRGVADMPVRTVTVGELTGLVSTVDLAEFGEEALRTNLEDLWWLERTARQHDDVVRAGARLTTTVPLRLATICADDDAVRRRLEDLRRKATTVLDELDGREEWGVKLFAPGESTANATTLDEGTDHAAPAGGVAYLQRRRRQLAGRAGRAEAQAREADWLHIQLASRAVRAHRHRPQDQRLSGAATPMLLNAAYLVERDRSDAFRQAVEELSGDRSPADVVVTGPWPPYSFATVDDR